MKLSAKFRMIQFMSTVDNNVGNLIEFTYGPTQNGEPRRRIERTDRPRDYSLLLSQRSNPKSVNKYKLIRKELLFEGQSAK